MITQEEKEQVQLEMLAALRKKGMLKEGDEVAEELTIADELRGSTPNQKAPILKAAGLYNDGQKYGTAGDRLPGPSGRASRNLQKVDAYDLVEAAEKKLAEAGISMEKVTPKEKAYRAKLRAEHQLQFKDPPEQHFERMAK